MSKNFPMLLLYKNCLKTNVNGHTAFGVWFGDVCGCNVNPF